MAPPQEKVTQRSRAVWIVGVATVLLLAAAAAYKIHRRTLTRVVQSSHYPADAYVDPSVCVGCHQEAADGYKKTGMGRSFSVPTEKNVVEDYSHANTVFNQPSNLHYTMIQRDGKFFQRRSEIGFDGKETNVMEERVDWVIGSGNHSRSYLHQQKDGKLIELPVSWYTEKGGYWAMSPGYDRKDQQDFRRAIKPECMFCHNAYPVMDAGLELSQFPSYLPEGIDCQRCHGPGLAHARAAMARNPDPQLVRSTIVNPANLSRDRQLDVCMQCHLETTRFQPNEERAFNRAVFSYQPGQPLGDYKMYFEPLDSDKDDSFGIVSAAYRLRKSACFRNSQMTCLTCHDPHAVPRGPEAIAHYTEVCLSCHSTVKHTVALPAQSTCMSCHMPKRRTEDAVHVVMTDHFIRRTQPARDLTAPIPETILSADAAPKMRLYYPEKKPPTAVADIAVAEAQVDDGGIAHLQLLLDRYQPDSPDPYLVLAKAYKRAGNADDDARWSEEAMTRSPFYPPALDELLPHLLPNRAEQVLNHARSKYYFDQVILTNLGMVYLKLGKTADAQDILESARDQNPDRPEVHDLLGVIAAQKGDRATAEKEFREALRCQPDFAEAHDHLGSLLIQQHKYAEAAYQFGQAISANSEFSKAQDHLGQSLALMDQLPRAVEELRQAVQKNPGDAQAHCDLASILAASGQTSAAATEFERALDLKPDDPEAHLGLANILLGQHRQAEARLQLLDAAKGSDADIAQRAEQLLRQMPLLTKIPREPTP